jgi:putative membrane protein
VNAERVFDAGLQPERTGLAWRRTAVSLAVGSLVALRVLPVHVGHVAATVPGLLGLVAAVVLGVVGEYRYRGTHRRLTGVVPGTVGGGAALLLTAAGCIALGVGALVLVAF